MDYELLEGNDTLKSYEPTLLQKKGLSFFTIMQRLPHCKDSTEVGESVTVDFKKPFNALFLPAAEVMLRDAVSTMPDFLTAFPQLYSSIREGVRKKSRWVHLKPKQQSAIYTPP
jgi:hypothetical protein